MRFEIKKLLFSKLFIVCFAVLMAVLAGITINAAGERVTLDGPYRKLLEAVKAAEGTEEEKLDDLLRKKEWLEATVLKDHASAVGTAGAFGVTLFDDLILYSRAYDDLRRYLSEFKNNRTRIVIDALEALEDEKQKSDPEGRIIKKNELVIDKYNRVIDLQPADPGKLDRVLDNYDVGAWQVTFVLFIVTLSVRMFTMDNSSGEYKVLNSSVLRKKALFFRRYLAVMTAGIIVWLLVCVFQGLMASVLFKVDDMSLPIQMTVCFEFCPFILSVGGFCLIRFLCGSLVIMSVSALTAFLCIVLQKTSISLATSAVLTLAPCVFLDLLRRKAEVSASNVLSGEYKMYELFRSLLPTGLLNVRTYFQGFDYTNVFEIFIPRIVCCVAVTATITVIFLVAAAAFFSGHIRKRESGVKGAKDEIKV